MYYNMPWIQCYALMHQRIKGTNESRKEIKKQDTNFK